MKCINREYSQRMKMQINIRRTVMFEALVVSDSVSSSLVNQELLDVESVLQTTHNHPPFPLHETLFPLQS